MKRDEVRTLIARQIAIGNGLVWSKVLSQPKLVATYLTLAGNILATVERAIANNVELRQEELWP